MSCLLKLSNGNLVSAGTDQEAMAIVGLVKVWDVSDMALLQQFKTVRKDVTTSLIVSEDVSTLASTSRDKTIRLRPIMIIFDDETDAESP